MIQLFQTDKMERSVDLLLQNFRNVLVDSVYHNKTRIRFRADDVKDPRVYFAKTKSQIDRWEKTGGVLVNWDPDVIVENDAILFVECPQSVWRFDRICQQTRAVAVVYRPPSWRVHDATVSAKPYKLERIRRDAWDTFTRMKGLVDSAPRLTPRSLARAIPQSSSARE